MESTIQNFGEKRLGMPVFRNLCKPDMLIDAVRERGEPSDFLLDIEIKQETQKG